MVQNKSSAVMQQRTEPADSLDDFPTPPWATRALCRWLMDQGRNLPHQSCLEPAANRGHMVKPLREYFEEVSGSDAHDYGAGFPVVDYLTPAFRPQADWTITNPPFKLAEAFAEKARWTSRSGYALLVRTSFLEGVGRYRRLFSLEPPQAILQFTERVVIHKGTLSAKGSTATSYCWLVWFRHAGPGHPRFHWIPPCRKALEREGDY